MTPLNVGKISQAINSVTYTAPTKEEAKDISEVHITVMSNSQENPSRAVAVIELNNLE